MFYVTNVPLKNALIEQKTVEICDLRVTHL